MLYLVGHGDRIAHFAMQHRFKDHDT